MSNTYTSSATINLALRWGIEQLSKANVDSPELDAELLLVRALHAPQSKQKGHKCTIAHKCPQDRAWLYGHWEESCSAAALRRFKRLIKRRARREPVAYILGHKEFYGLDFLVNKNVLIPRPETELLIEQVLEEIKCSMFHDPCSMIIDVGTGSGAIIVSLAKKLSCKMFAIDNSLAALTLAKKNAWRHGVDSVVTFIQGNLLEPLMKCSARIYPRPSDPKGSHYIIIANLPYLPTSEWRATAPEIKKYEPRGALDGGRDGLKYYRQMFQQLYKWIHNPPQPSLILREGAKQILPLRIRGSERGLRVTCICEFCPHQAGAFKKMILKYFSKAKIKIIKDLAGKDRAVKIRI